jgi:hypothetical protein
MDQPKSEIGKYFELNNNYYSISKFVGYDEALLWENL